MDGIHNLDDKINKKKLNIYFYEYIILYIIKMSTQYIVKFRTISNDDDFSSSEFVDGFAEISEHKLSNSAIPTISVRTHKSDSDAKNVVLFQKYITNKFAQINFSEDEKICSIQYNDGYNHNKTYTSFLKFDSNSSSAYSDFKKNFESHLNSKYETEYYNNGRIMYVGEILYNKDDEGKTTNRVPNGNGTLYFNTFGKNIKYNGEFDDGSYDGSGTFYNKDGKVTITSLNISNGIPTQKGKLKINYTDKYEVIDINFNELWEKVGIETKKQKKDFVMKDNFVNEVTKIYWQKDDLNLNELTFREKNATEQRTELWKELKKIKQEIIQKQTVTENKSENNYKMMFNLLIITFSINMAMHFIKGTIC
tara:strand:+ start:537 stop:1631 length:1095 start_codon:yes stop_codon:yes gene_type:complete